MMEKMIRIVEKVLKFCKVYDKEMIEALFDEMLDENQENIKIGSLEYLPSDVLKSTDPIAYREELLNFINDEVKNHVLVSFDGNRTFYMLDEVVNVMSEIESKETKRSN